jgi:hypothetical protein
MSNAPTAPTATTAAQAPRRRTEQDVGVTILLNSEGGIVGPDEMIVEGNARRLDAFQQTINKATVRLGIYELM